jgi:hypothetical protein
VFTSSAKRQPLQTGSAVEFSDGVLKRIYVVFCLEDSKEKAGEFSDSRIKPLKPRIRMEGKPYKL